MCHEIKRERQVWSVCMCVVAEMSRAAAAVAQESSYLKTEQEASVLESEKLRVV